MWPFAKKKDGEAGNAHASYVAPAEESQPVGVEAAEAMETEESDTPDPLHDAVSGEIGPFDADSVNIEEFDFSDFSQGTLNLGSVLIPLPRGSEVQVEMGKTGPQMLHIVTQYGRITPVAFAAPKRAGQWREATKKNAEDMRRDGHYVRIEQGPWGREVVGQINDLTIRLIGVDGPRWMLQFTLIAPTELADKIAELGREVTARTFVRRGEQPMLAGTALPMAMPDVLVNHIRQAMEQRAKQAQQAASGESGQSGQPAQPKPSDQSKHTSQHSTSAAPADPPPPPTPTPPKGPAASAFQQMKAEPR